MSERSPNWRRAREAAGAALGRKVRADEDAAAVTVELAGRLLAAEDGEGRRMSEDTRPNGAEVMAVVNLGSALTYARTYWQHGSEPQTQAALRILADRVDALEADLEKATNA